MSLCRVDNPLTLLGQLFNHRGIKSVEPRKLVANHSYVISDCVVESPVVREDLRDVGQVDFVSIRVAERVVREQHNQVCYVLQVYLYDLEFGEQKVRDGEGRIVELKPVLELYRVIHLKLVEEDVDLGPGLRVHVDFAEREGGVERGRDLDETL